jgi:hypothetical protein
LTVPGEDAKPEEIAAYHKAIGVPDNADGYVIDLPEGVTEEQLDMPMLGAAARDRAQGRRAGTRLRGDRRGRGRKAARHARGFAEGRGRKPRRRCSRSGAAQKDAKLADVNNATRALGLTPVDVAAIQRGFAMQYGEPGSRKTLELLQKLGAGVAEDALLGGDGPRRFGITGAEAQAEIDKLTVDSEFGEKLAQGSGSCCALGPAQCRRGCRSRPQGQGSRGWLTVECVAASARRALNFREGLDSPPFFCEPRVYQVRGDR